MKREHSEIDNDDNYLSKKAKVTKSLQKLLEEVSSGNYEDFRTWLVQNKCKLLDLSYGKAKGIAFSHLGKALQGTQVTVVNLRSYGLGGKAVEEFIQALKHTPVTHVNFSENFVRHFEPTFRHAFKDTVITHVNFSNNWIDNQAAEKIIQALQGSQVTHLNLSNNAINNFGVIPLFKLLSDNNVCSLNLNGNPITKSTAFEIGMHIENSSIIQLTLPFEDIFLTETLKKYQAAFEFARTHFFDEQKKQQLIGEHHPALTVSSPKQGQIKFAACALANVPIEVAQHIYSFLPLMNSKKVDKIFKAAEKRQSTFIECDTLTNGRMQKMR